MRKKIREGGIRSDDFFSRLSSLLSVNGAAVESCGDGVNSPMHRSICSLFENTESHGKSGLALNVNLQYNTVFISISKWRDNGIY